MPQASQLDILYIIAPSKSNNALPGIVHEDLEYANSLPFQNKVLNYNEILWKELESLNVEAKAWEDEELYLKEVAPKVTPIYNKLIKRIALEQPRCLGFFIYDDSLLLNFHMIRKIKRVFPEIKIFYKGPKIDCLQARKDLKRGIVDAAILDQNNHCFDELLNCWLGEHPKYDLDGVMVIDPEGFVKLGSKQEAAHQEGMNVLLAILPAWNSDYPPLGVAHIASALKAKKHNVKLVDYNAIFWHKMRNKMGDCGEYEHMQVWKDPRIYEKKIPEIIEPTIQAILNDMRERNIQAIGFSVFETSIIVTMEAMRRIRREFPQVKIFVGGPSVDKEFSRDRFHEGLIDAAVLGEGEYSVQELMSFWKSEKDELPEGIAGTIIKLNNGNLSHGPSRPLAKLDDLPPPDYSDFDIYNYKYFMLPLFFSRGCVAKCSFCYETLYWQKFRVKSPVKIVEEMEKNITRYGIDNFHISDSLMNGSHQLLEKMTDIILEKKLNIRYSGYCRLDKKLTRSLLQKMKDSGCIEINYGMESGSQKVLDLMKKEVDTKYYTRIIKDTYEVGIQANVCMMVGYPGETWWDFFQSVWTIFSLRNYLTDMNLSIFGPMEHTMDNIQKTSGYEIIMFDEKTQGWITSDRKNTQKIRVLRYKILKSLWTSLKKKNASIDVWGYSLTPDKS